MMMPLGSSGGRQLTSTEDESSALSCSSSGGVDGPVEEGTGELGEGGGSVIRVQKQGLAAVEFSVPAGGSDMLRDDHLRPLCVRHLGAENQSWAGQ